MTGGPRCRNWCQVTLASRCHDDAQSRLIGKTNEKLKVLHFFEFWSVEFGKWTEIVGSRGLISFSVERFEIRKGLKTVPAGQRARLQASCRTKDDAKRYLAKGNLLGKELAVVNSAFWKWVQGKCILSHFKSANLQSTYLLFLAR